MDKKRIFIGIVAICGLLITGFYSTEDGTKGERVSGGDVVKSANIEINTETIFIEEQENGLSEYEEPVFLPEN